MPAQLYARARSPLEINNDAVTGSSADIHITNRGSEFYWGLTAVFAIGAILMLAWAQLQSLDRRFYHKTVALSCLVMAMTYFTMASNLGWVGIAVEWVREGERVAGATRQIFWVRYIGWTLSFPLIISNLYFTAGLSWPSISNATVFAWFFVIGRLLGALVATTYKWGYFVFCLIGYIYLSFDLLIPARSHAVKTLNAVFTAYTLPVIIYVGLLWILYPIAWGVSEGGNYIAPDSEAVFYGVIDLFAFMFVPIYSLVTLRKVDVKNLRAGEKRGTGQGGVTEGDGDARID
ncbi:FDD123 protein [Massarina eburnea CBS 473.64]|uniref:FDD123 protein n=1 Tax=Massarina eburnea CBS 473.64 TaxID=1395130 RepID=A0A6A6RX39_9PLEO|nr:FDD123 protein [Massarina eburnea CBS 473.64]